jgi:predicted nucleic acid-binding protein
LVCYKKSYISHGHITDIYLLKLAVHNGGKLATLDRRILAEVLDGGMDALHVIM